MYSKWKTYFCPICTYSSKLLFKNKSDRHKIFKCAIFKNDNYHDPISNKLQKTEFQMEDEWKNHGKKMTMKTESI